MTSKPNGRQATRAAVASGRFAAVAVAALLTGCGGEFPPPPESGNTPGERYREEQRQQNEEALARAARSDRAQQRREGALRLRRERAADRAERATEEAEPEESEDCDSNYSGCVPVYPPDVNCEDVDGPVNVTGEDVHQLDREGDGEACEDP